MKKHRIRLIVNGDEAEVTVESRMLLSDLIRHQLKLTGTHHMFSLLRHCESMGWNSH